MHYVYILQSKLDNELYLGSTNNLKERFRQHNDGKSTSTKRYKPWKLLYYEAYELESLARLREKRLKYNGNAIRELKKRIGFSKKIKL
jgi:putative endonuclease